MKDIRFCDRSLEALGSFPAVAKREAGYQLDRLQHGLEPTDRKPMPSIGPGVREIRIMHKGQFRVIYTAKLADAVHVPHAFQKKTKKTRKQDIDAAQPALKQLLQRGMGDE
jgi:phage-related protein